MPYIELTTPGTIVDSGTYWSNTNAIKTNDGLCASAIGALSSNYMLVTNWSPSLPVSGKVTGVEAIFTCWATGGSGTLYGGLTFNGTTISGSSYSISGITAAATSFTLGSSATLWGNGAITNQSIATNFGIAVKMDGSLASTLRLIDHIKLRVHYDSSIYLQGGRSSFPSAKDSVPKKVGGSTALSQILAEDINTLGDCLFNIEKTALSLTNPASSVNVKGTGYKSLYLYAITVTGSTTGQGHIYLDRLVNRSNTVSSISVSTSAWSGSGITDFPPSTSEVNCKFVSAIGWVTSGAVTVPVYVSPRSYIYNTINGSKSYYFGFTAVGSGIIASSAESTSSDYYGNLVTPAAVPAGVLTIKMLALLNGVI